MNPHNRPESTSLPPDRPTGGPGSGGIGDLRRLKMIGVALPIIFVVSLEMIRLRVFEHDTAHIGTRIVLGGLTILAVIAFSFVMFHFIDRAQIGSAQLVSDLRRRQREGHGFYDVLLRISNQNDLADILAAVARHASDLLSSDDAVVCLSNTTTRSVHLDWAPLGTATLPDGVCISPTADASHALHDHGADCPVQSSPKFRESLCSPIRSRDKTLGELWIGRESAVPFTERDGQFLSTLSDLASIAITSARIREGEWQSAILAERERIAREMHDSLAQILGVTHLRLRALGSRDDTWDMQATAAELTELADICQEGYRDVREAILDLRESSRTDRGLVDGLRAYLDKYSQQSGITASLEITPGLDLVLPPRAEIQIIRVIQEALTNVRKHSGATSAVVKIAEADGTATFVVEDDGRGFDLDATLDGGGFGLHSMRERIEIIRGTLLIDSAPGRGTRVVAKVPGIDTQTPTFIDRDRAAN